MGPYATSQLVDLIGITPRDAVLDAGSGIGGTARYVAGLLVLTLTGGRVCALTRFDNDVLPSFGLPRWLPD